MLITTDEKSELLALIRRAKSSHIRWRAYAQGMLSGVPVSEERLPIKHTECRFGHWYYGEGKVQFGDLEIFQDIEGPHELLHAIYEQIHSLVERKKVDQAKVKFQELLEISRSLLEQMELLESEVQNLEIASAA